jgi:hypothetical protein
MRGTGVEEGRRVDERRQEGKRCMRRERGGGERVERAIIIKEGCRGRGRRRSVK